MLQSADVQGKCRRQGQPGRRAIPRCRLRPCLLPVLLAAATQAAAADLGSVAGFDVRLDTGVRTSLGVRVQPQDRALLGALNADDGDRAFARGVNSERIDLATQLDVTRGELGLDVGADGWYDAVYHQPDANRSPQTFNPVSVPNDAFPADVRRLLGDTAELGNAFVHDKISLGGLPVTVRIGRQALLWGESLFFPRDGIAAGQAPVDQIKLSSQPLVQSREVYLPVTQADVRVQLPYALSLEAYEQLEWRRDRIPGVASYFSTSDVLDAGGERLLGPGGTSLARGRDVTPAGTGQYGVALRRSAGSLDVGLYGLRYAAKGPQILAPAADPASYQLVFPHGIDLLGVSASGYLGNANLSGEVSQRWHMPLVSGGSPAVPGSAAPDAVARGALPSGYATGRTLQALVSFDAQLPPGRPWNAASIDAEIVATDLLGVEANAGRRLPGTTRLSSAFQLVVAPHYFQVLPNLDVTVPLGIELGLNGRSSVDAGQVAGAGAVTLSANAVYRTIWQAGVSFTYFVGSADSQALADRAFVEFEVSRTF